MLTIKPASSPKPNVVVPGTVLHFEIRPLDTGRKAFAASNGSVPYLIAQVGSEPSFSFPVFTPGDSVLQVATTTTNDFCNQQMPYDDSSIISATLTAVPNGLCRVAAFLVVPSQNSLSQFSLLASSTTEKIPFSYYYDFADIVGGQATSTSQNMQNFAMNLSLLDFASSTAMGPILPSSLSFLSSTTIGQYMSPTMHDIIYNLMIFAIWGEVLFLLYHKIIPAKAKI